MKLTAIQAERVAAYVRRRRIWLAVGCAIVIALVAGWNLLLVTRPHGVLTSDQVVALALGVSTALLATTVPLMYWLGWRVLRIIGEEARDGTVATVDARIAMLFYLRWRPGLFVRPGNHRWLIGVFDDEVRGPLREIKARGGAARFTFLPHSRTLVGVAALPDGAAVGLGRTPDPADVIARQDLTTADVEANRAHRLSPTQRDRLDRIARRRLHLARGFGLYFIAGAVVGAAVEIAVGALVRSIPGLVVVVGAGVYLLAHAAPRARRLRAAIEHGEVATRDGSVEAASRRQLALGGARYESIDPHLDDLLDDVEPGTRLAVHHLPATRTVVAVELSR